jgi:hypothetical protein
MSETVKVYYCKCGKSIMRACHPDLLIGNDSETRARRKEFKQAADWGRKVAEITIEEYRNTPFMECDLED